MENYHTFQLFTFSNAEHFDQRGMSIPGDTVDHDLDRKIRQFEVTGAAIPGMYYDFKLR